MISISRLIFIIFSFKSLCTLAQIQAEDNSRLSVGSTPDFEITGDGTAPAWRNAEWFELSKAGGPLQHTTRAKMLYSDKGIYTLFHCEDKKITSTLKEDFASLWKEDVLEIFYWTDESAP